MFNAYANGQTSVVLRPKLRRLDTGQGLTGLTISSAGLIISTIADNEATPTVYTQAGSTVETVTTLGTFAAPTATKCRFREVDATNHPGAYEIQIADARFGVVGAKALRITISGVTNLAECDLLIPLQSVNPYDAVRGGMTALPNVVSGNAGAVLTAGTGTGQLSVTSGVADANVVKSLNVAVTNNDGTAQAGASGSITLAAGAPASSLVGWGVYLNTGTGAQQFAVVTAYNTTTKVATIRGTWPVTPDATTTYTLYPPVPVSVESWRGATPNALSSGQVDAAATVTLGANAPAGWLNAAAFASGSLNGKGDWLLASGYTAPPTSSVVAGAVWDLATSGHTTTGTFGNAAVAAGSAGDPWATTLPGAYGAGSAGNIIGNRIDAAVTTRLPTLNYTPPPSAASIATTVEQQILDETDGRTVIAAIVAKINATDTNLSGLTLSAIAAAVRDVDNTAPAANSLGERVNSSGTGFGGRTLIMRGV